MPDAPPVTRRRWRRASQAPARLESPRGPAARPSWPRSTPARTAASCPASAAWRRTPTSPSPT
ncbi:hypothetical protein BAE44_0007616 [Dichanthelium oligosanthes]|uniref:Uncharacterized protein n=1 Tax=Dichanthelium oligosanthes TaxID=888268 RepID=A0A1E5W1Z2_9POAL|nr:hypothetical protein BAE44_0007616 [Dichanthelium oligosanthes]